MSLSFALLCVMGCGGGDGDAPKARTGRAAEPPEVEVAAVVAQEHRPTLELPATIAPRERVQVAARVEGAVTRVFVDLGDRVSANGALARIASDDFRARLAQADAELNQAHAELARNAPLEQQGLVTAQDLERLRTRIAVLESQRVLGARTVHDSTVRAPFEGLVAARLISPGAYVRVGQPLFDFVSAGEPIAVIEIPESVATAVQVGAPVEVSVRASAGGAPSVQGVLARKAPTASVETRTVRGEVSLPSELSVSPGAFVTARVATGEPISATRIPQTAVYTLLGRYRAAVVGADNKVDVRDLDRVGEEGESVLVVGLTPGERVVVRSPASLTAGTVVRVKGAEGARADGQLR